LIAGVANQPAAVDIGGHTGVEGVVVETFDHLAVDVVGITLVLARVVALLLEEAFVRIVEILDTLE